MVDCGSEIKEYLTIFRPEHVQGLLGRPFLLAKLYVKIEGKEDSLSNNIHILSGYIKFLQVNLSEKTRFSQTSNLLSNWSIFI